VAHRDSRLLLNDASAGFFHQAIESKGNISAVDHLGHACGTLGHARRSGDVLE